MMGTQREFNPIEAAYAVAQYLPADPVLWIERCALSGVLLSVTSDGYLCECWQNGDVRADRSQTTFLTSWLNLSPPSARAAVIELLRERGQAAS